MKVQKEIILELDAVDQAKFAYPRDPDLKSK